MTAVTGATAVNVASPLLEGLRKGLADLQLVLDVAQLEQLLVYMALIEKWNKVYNLTAVRNPADMLTHHVLDSLAAIPALLGHIRAQQSRIASAPGMPAGAVNGAVHEAVNGAVHGRVLRLLDVGSGAGLPGVVVAICCPWLAVDCVDTVGKKAAFIQQVAATLKLGNLRGLHARVEALTDTYDVVTSRAFASLADFTAWSGRALADDGVWMAMKGKTPDEEMQALPAHIQVFHVEPLVVPGLQAQRCLVWMRPTA